MGWKPKGARLRALREQMEFSIERLAAEAGVGEKTIRNLESGRTRIARAATLKAIAAVLDVDLAELGVFADAAEKSAPKPKRGKPPAGKLPPPSRLEALVEIQRGLKRHPPRVATASGLTDQLTPKRLQDVVTAYLLHEGSRFWIAGEVSRQHGISREEGAVLETKSGLGARFLLTNEIAPKEPLYVTVYARTAEQTRLLQQRIDTGVPVAVIARVFVVHAEADRLLVTNLAGGDPQPVQGIEPTRWSGFFLYGSQSLHPWTLVIEEVLAARAKEDERGL